MENDINNTESLRELALKVLERNASKTNFEKAFDRFAIEQGYVTETEEALDVGGYPPPEEETRSFKGDNVIDFMDYVNITLY